MCAACAETAIPASATANKEKKEEAAENAADVSQNDNARLPPVRLVFASTTTSGVSRRLDVQGICGSVGFELEFAGLVPYYREANTMTRTYFGSDWSKTVLQKNTTYRFAIELDKDHLEIVTEPCAATCTSDPAAALSGVRGQLEGIQRFVRLVRELAREKTIPFTIDLQAQTIDKCKELLQTHQITTVHLKGHAGTDPLGTMQATIGTTLERFPKLLAIETPRIHGIAAELWEQFGAKVAHDVANVRGLFFACVYYIETLGTIEKMLTESDGLKTKLPLLARTDFASMYRLLASDAGAEFSNCIKTAYAQYLKQKLVPGGWVHPSTPDVTRKGPTIGRWLDSIAEPTQLTYDRARKALPFDKDDLSPPDGYEVHIEGVLTYSMGKYGAIPCACGIHSLVLFELRDVAQQCPVSKFCEIAEDIASFAMGKSDRMEFRLPESKRALKPRRKQGSYV